MKLLSVGDNLKQFLRVRPVVHKKVLLLFWYMKEHWRLLRNILQPEPVKGYLWPLYQASLDNEKISIIILPGPGMGIMDIIAREICFLGGSIFFLFGNAALINENLGPDCRLLVSSACTLRENPLAGLNSFGAVKAHGKAEILFTHPEVEKRLQSDLSRTVPLYAKGCAWTTISPYSFSAEELFAAKKENCICIEMESFALFRASEENSARAFAFLYPRDLFTKDGWRALRGFGSSNAQREEKINLKELLEIVLLFLKYL